MITLPIFPFTIICIFALIGFALVVLVVKGIIESL